MMLLLQRRRLSRLYGRFLYFNSITDCTSALDCSCCKVLFFCFFVSFPDPSPDPIRICFRAAPLKLFLGEKNEGFHAIKKSSRCTLTQQAAAKAQERFLFEITVYRVHSPQFLFRLPRDVLPFKRPSMISVIDHLLCHAAVNADVFARDKARLL